MSQAPPRRGKVGRFAWYWAPVLLYLAIIFMLSAQPHLQAPLQFENGDKICHLLEYGGLGVLMVRALRSGGRFRSAATASLAVVVLGAAVGALDEYFQSFVPGRDASIYDWMADTSGVVLGQFLYLLVVTRRRDMGRESGRDSRWA